MKTWKAFESKKDHGDSEEEGDESEDIGMDEDPQSCPRGVLLGDESASDENDKEEEEEAEEEEDDDEQEEEVLVVGEGHSKEYDCPLCPSENSSCSSEEEAS